MRYPTLLWLVVILTLVTTAVSAWTKDDHEIFDLVSELESTEGKGTDFYKFLEVAPGASSGELGRAYRKRSLELHPDKNPNVKNVHERFARLGKIATILRNGEKRERYDFFLQNGVPRWRGTGYYYARYRPSIIEVVLFLVALSTAVHYLVLRLNHRRDVARIDYFRSAAMRSAGVSDGLGLGRAGKAAQDDGSAVVETAFQQAVLGAKATDPAVIESAAGTPAPNRAERRKQLKGGSRDSTPGSNVSTTATASKEEKRRKVRVPLIEGSDRAGSLDLIVVDREVFVPEEDGSLTPLSHLAPSPSWSALWPAKFVTSAVSAVSGRGVPADNDVASSPPAPVSAPRSRRGVDVSEPVASASASDDEEEGEDSAAGTGGEARKKRRNGNGKVAGMRRRKMGGK